MAGYGRTSAFAKATADLRASAPIVMIRFLVLLLVSDRFEKEKEGSARAGPRRRRRMRDADNDCRDAR